ARAAAVARECSVARAQQIDEAASFSVWRVSSLTAQGENQTYDNVSARLENAWGPLANQFVTFKVEGQEVSCSASTNADGVVSCELPTHVAGDTKVLVNYDGAEGQDFVDLPSKTEITLTE